MPNRPGAALPPFIKPELATLVDEAPDGPEWLHEIKLDGYRTMARIEAGTVQLLTRTGLDWTARFKPIAASLAKLPAETAYLDGEVAVIDAQGISSFAALQDALSRGHAARLVYYAFDLPFLNGRDLATVPLDERKIVLEELLADEPKTSPIRYSAHVQGKGPAFFKLACEKRVEGIVSKLATSPYRSRRTTEWLKVKCLQRQEFVIGGWEPSDKAGRSLRSLLLGYYDGAGKLVFAGKAGTGFSLQMGADLVRRLARVERKSPPFASVPPPYGRNARWARPELVAEVAFSNWTTDNVLRHPSFEGLREDKPAREVRLERPVPKAGVPDR